MRTIESRPSARPEVPSRELRSNSELAAVASDGLVGHPITLALACFATSMVSDHPLVMCAFVFAFGLQTAVRMILVRHVAPDESRNGPKWRSRMMATLSASGALWGTLAAWSCVSYGYHSATTILLLLYHGAISVFGISAFVDDLRLARRYTFLVFVPPMVAHGMYPDGELWVPLVTFAFFAVFLYQRATKLHAEFRRRHAAEERYALAVSGNNDGIWEWDVTTGAVYYSPRWKQMLGLPAETACSALGDWFTRVHPDDIVGLRRALEDYVHHGLGLFEREHRLRHSDGTWRWVQARGAAMRDVKGVASRVAGSKSDVTAGKLSDPLTGLANRLAVIERIEQLIERAREQPSRGFALMFLDLDRFKLINDSLGHVVGDQLLLGVASRLSHVLRSQLGPAGCIGRLGGDEFVALLDGVADNAALEGIAASVLREMEAPIHLSGTQLSGASLSGAPGNTLNGAPIFVRASIGLARGGAGQTPEDLLRNADTAMYHAKATGRGRYQAFDSSMHQRALARLELETDLRHALDRNQFELFFQPQVELARGTLSGFEALLRWHHPERGLILPGEFIPVVEENGLIIPLGQWVIRQACLKMAFWRSVFPDAGNLTISVNLSSKQFSDPALAAVVAAILVETALPPARLHLEITESILADDPEAARNILSDLKSMGIGLEIDDFGTGYSSLGQLHRLPFDTMKVDRGFVRAMDHEPDGRKIVQSITSLARSLGIVVVAEGIETEDHWLLLEALGCQYGQGFFFAEPLNSAAAQVLIAHRLNEPWPWPANALSKSISDLLALGPALEDNAALTQNITREDATHETR